MKSYDYYGGYGREPFVPKDDFDVAFAAFCEEVERRVGKEVAVEQAIDAYYIRLDYDLAQARVGRLIARIQRPSTPQYGRAGDVLRFDGDKPTYAGNVLRGDVDYSLFGRRRP